MYDTWNEKDTKPKSSDHIFLKRSMCIVDNILLGYKTYIDKTMNVRTYYCKSSEYQSLCYRISTIPSTPQNTQDSNEIAHKYSSRLSNYSQIFEHSPGTTRSSRYAMYRVNTFRIRQSVLPPGNDFEQNIQSPALKLCSIRCWHSVFYDFHLVSVLKTS